MTTKISVNNLIKYINDEYETSGKSELYQKIENKVLSLNNAKLSCMILNNCKGVSKEKHIRVMFNSNALEYLHEIINLTSDEKMLEDVYNFYMAEREKMVLTSNKPNHKFSVDAYKLAVKYPKADASKLFDFLIADGSFYNMIDFMNLEKVDAKKILANFFNSIEKENVIYKGEEFAKIYKRYMLRKNKIKGLDLQKVMIDELMKDGTGYRNPYEQFFVKIPFEQIDIDYMVKSAVKTDNEQWASLVITTIISLAQKTNRQYNLVNVNFQPLIDIALKKSSMDTLTNLATLLGNYQDISQIENYVRENGTYKDAINYILRVAKNMKNYPEMERKILNEITDKDIYLLKELFSSWEITKNNNLDIKEISKRILIAKNCDVSWYFAGYYDVDFEKHLQVVKDYGNDSQYKNLLAVAKYRKTENDKKTTFNTNKFLDNKEELELIF